MAQTETDTSPNDQKSYYRCPHCHSRAVLHTPAPKLPYRLSAQGVCWKSGKWEAYVGKKYLGRFTYKKDALAVRKTYIDTLKENAKQT